MVDGVHHRTHEEAAMSQQGVEAAIFWGLLMTALMIPWLMP